MSASVPLRAQLANGRACETTSVASARDAAICCSIALQFGADIETIQKALCRDSLGRPSGPLGAALDLIAERRK
jgi:hypothetical protein